MDDEKRCRMHDAGYQMTDKRGQIVGREMIDARQQMTDRETTDYL